MVRAAGLYQRRCGAAENEGAHPAVSARVGDGDGLASDGPCESIGRASALAGRTILCKILSHFPAGVQKVSPAFRPT